MQCVADNREHVEGVHSVNKKGAISIEFVRGVHTSAVQKITDNEWLLVGTAEDCDILLSDGGIMPRHCLLSLLKGKLCVRALEGSVIWGDDTILPGETRTETPWGELQIGEAAIRIMKPLAPKVRSSSKSWHYGWVLATLVLSSAATYGMAVSWIGDGRSGDKGVVSANDLQKEKQALIASEKAAELEAGKRMASSLKDILRLSGYDADANYIDNGVVEVSGYFGDGFAIAKTVRSRAVHDIAGLKKVQVVNKSAPPNIAEKTASPPAPRRLETKMVKIIWGSDPYLVGTEGSRYYPGAKLPSGLEMVSIMDKTTVLVKAENGEETFMDVSELFAN